MSLASMGPLTVITNDEGFAFWNEKPVIEMSKITIVTARMPREKRKVRFVFAVLCIVKYLLIFYTRIAL